MSSEKRIPDRASGHCRYSSKVLEPVMSHIVDAIKMIVHCSKDEDFMKRCFATFGVEDFNGFSQTLSTELRTIAGRRYGLSDLLQEKELVSTTSKGKGNPVYRQSASTNENVTQDCEMSRQTRDSLFDFLSDIEWDTSKAESKNYASGQNETTRNSTVKKGTTVPQLEGKFPNQVLPLASQSTSMYTQPLKDGEDISKQTLVKNTECTGGTQEYETYSSTYEHYHFSKSDTGNRGDDWSNDFSQDDFGANITGSHSPSKGCLHSSNNYLTNCTKNKEWLSNSGCHVTDEYPTGDTPVSQNHHKSETGNQIIGEDQCVPSASNNATQHLSLNNMDDFDSLAEIF